MNTRPLAIISALVIANALCAPVIAEVSIQRTILDPTRPILDTGVLTPTIPTRPRIDSTPVRPRAARPPKPRPPRSDT